MDNLPTRVIAVIREEATGPLTDVQPHHSLAALEIDVIDRVCICRALDEAFGIELADAEIDGWHTVADVIATVRAAVEAEQRAKVEGRMGYATVPEIETWARAIMRSRRPDFVIGADYLRRWWVVPRNEFANQYLHEIRKSDDDRALHDHPWPNSSLILAGRYIEHTPDGSFLRVAGDFVQRPAEALHRLEVIPGERAVTLFMTGPKIREWGFSCPQGWVHWKDFTDPTDSSRTGRGCGEL